MFFKRAPSLYLWVCKRNEMKVTEVYCWAITHAAGRSCGGSSGSSVLEFGFQLDFPVYTYIIICILAHNLTCSGSSRTSQLRKPGNVCTQLVTLEELSWQLNRCNFVCVCVCVCV
jgi:hypothetical protein